jgi:four helix bundle protein
LAEGQARQYANEFRHFLSVASGSLAELDTQRIIAMNVGFLSQEDSVSLEQKIAEVRKMLYALTRSIKAEN